MHSRLNPLTVLSRQTDSQTILCTSDATDAFAHPKVIRKFFCGLGSAGRLMLVLIPPPMKFAARAHRNYQLLANRVPTMQRRKGASDISEAIIKVCKLFSHQEC